MHTNVYQMYKMVFTPIKCIEAYLYTNNAIII